MPSIPIHQLQDRAEGGIEVHYFRPGDKDDEATALGAHRDDHYLFFLLDEGTASLMIDFKEFTFVPGTLYYILPGQVHHRIKSDIGAGWFLAADTSLLSPEHRQVFENRMDLQQPVNLAPAQSEQYIRVLSLMIEKFNEDKCSPFHWSVIYALLHVFAGMVATTYYGSYAPATENSRKMELTQRFKTLLSANLKTIKSPSNYADMLHVSESYLNEALKKVTGMPVSYWIMNEAVLEAKRLLYYSNLNVKEIAHELGYEDHTYFSRLFKQSTGFTPLTFRRQYRE
jgi:AraC-like DNA-binding protein